MNRQLDQLIPAPCRDRFCRRIKEGLQRAGFVADVSVAIDDPQDMPASAQRIVLGSRGAACRPTVMIKVCPDVNHPRIAFRWARERLGREIIESIAAAELPAHVAFRLNYVVIDRRGREVVSDPPRFGLARYGCTYLEKPMKRRLKVGLDAVSLEIANDVAEIFGMAPDDLRFDELKQRLNERERSRRVHGQVIDPIEFDRLDALERMVVSLSEQVQRLLRRVPRMGEEAKSISINPKRTKS